MNPKMTACPICDYHYSGSLRSHCPTCGAQTHKWTNAITIAVQEPKAEPMQWNVIVVAHGAERARQLPQSPRCFQLVD